MSSGAVVCGFAARFPFAEPLCRVAQARGVVLTIVVILFSLPRLCAQTATRAVRATRPGSYLWRRLPGQLRSGWTTGKGKIDPD